MGVKTRRSSRTRGPSQAAPRKRRTPREAATGCLGDPEDPWRDTSQRPLDLQVAAVAIAREKHKHPPCVLNPRNTVHCGKRLDTPGRQMRAAAAFLPRHAKVGSGSGRGSARKICSQGELPAVCERRIQGSLSHLQCWMLPTDSRQRFLVKRAGMWLPLPHGSLPFQHPLPE